MKLVSHGFKEPTKPIALITEPTICVLAEMQIENQGLRQLVSWLGSAAPGCLPDDWAQTVQDAPDSQQALQELIFTHQGLRESGFGLTDNEQLVELAGRKCYNSFGKKAGHNTNASYIANILGGPGKIFHASVLYHAKMTFFFAGISRRMSHELIRHYVGADRSEEGCPSQESTRYTEHPGHFIVHPRMLSGVEGVEEPDAQFQSAMQHAYTQYLNYLSSEVRTFKQVRGEEPKGMDRKRIYEAAAMLLPGAAATSMIWTTNPVALAKLFQERCDSAADLEFQRFATKLRALSYERWPNLFRESNPAVER